MATITKLKRQRPAFVLATCVFVVVWHIAGFGARSGCPQPVLAAEGAQTAAAVQATRSVALAPVWGRVPETQVQADAWQTQKAFCDALPPVRQQTIEIPWTEGAVSKRRLLEGGQLKLGRRPLGDTGRPAVIAVREGIHTDLPFGPSEKFSLYHYKDDAAQQDIVSSFIAFKGSWEIEETHQLATAMHAFAEANNKAHDEVYMIDIGANIGAHTMFAAAFGFNVLAFEPLRINALSIRHSLCANPGLIHRVTLINKGLGNTNQKCTIYSIASNIGDGTVKCDGEHPRSDMLKRGDLETARMDDLLKEWMPKLKGRVGVIKIDIEGFEPYAIEGAMEFLRVVRPPTIMSEVSDEMIKVATEKSSTEFLKDMLGLGYTIRKGRPDGEQVLQNMLTPEYTETGQNYWFHLPSLKIS